MRKIFMYWRTQPSVLVQSWAAFNLHFALSPWALCFISHLSRTSIELHRLIETILTHSTWFLRIFWTSRRVSFTVPTSIFMVHISKRIQLNTLVLLCVVSCALHHEERYFHDSWHSQENAIPGMRRVLACSFFFKQSFSGTSLQTIDAHIFDGRRDVQKHKEAEADKKKVSPPIWMLVF